MTQVRTALVGGASSGLGRAVAEALLRAGCRVAITSSSADRVAQTAEEIGAHPFVLDAADVDAAPNVVRTVEAAVGPLDILVTNTGGPPGGPDPLAFTRDQWEQAYRTLVLAPMALISAVLPGMRARRHGRIVNISSTAVREPIAGLMLSNVHRAATLAAFKTLARHVAADGVTLNTLLPGPIATDRLLSLTAGDPERIAGLYGMAVPAGRPGTVEEFAAAAAFLCSDAASYVSGEAMRVDGGLTVSI